MTSAVFGAGGFAAVCAYLNAKFGLEADLEGLYEEWIAETLSRRAKSKNRVSLWCYFEDQIKRFSNQDVCIWTPDIQYSWLQTYDISCQYAQMLLSKGVNPGELVALFLHNRAEFMFCSLGAWAIGSAPAPINYNLSGDGLIHCLKISGTKIVLVDWDPDLQSRITEVSHRIETDLGMQIVFLTPDHEEIKDFEAQRPEDRLIASIGLDSPVFLQYTSGSTGFPKSVPFPYRRAAVQLAGFMRRLRLRSGPGGDRWYVPMPLYHGTGFVIAWACMAKGYTLCLSRKFSASRFWDEVRVSKASAFVYVGEAVRYLLTNPASPSDRQHQVKVMFGNGMRPDVWSRFSERFGVDTRAEFFNSSEGMLGLVNVCRGPYREFAVGYQGLLRRWLTRNLYTPVQIDAETGNIVRDASSGLARKAQWDTGGEILIKCNHESDFVGYYLNAEATEKKFAHGVFRKGDLYFRTGDALRRTPDGRWFFLDRLGDTFRWKSENVATTEVAQALADFQGIVEVVVYGVEVPGHDGKAGCAAIFLLPEVHERGLDYTAFLQFAMSRLPRYAVPVFLRILNEPSLTGNAKQNKTPLKAEGIDYDKLVDSAVAKGSIMDKVLWYPPGLGLAGDAAYIEYRADDWQALQLAAQPQKAAARL